MVYDVGDVFKPQASDKNPLGSEYLHIPHTRITTVFSIQPEKTTGDYHMTKPIYTQ